MGIYSDYKEGIWATILVVVGFMALMTVIGIAMCWSNRCLLKEFQEKCQKSCGLEAAKVRIMNHSSSECWCEDENGELYLKDFL